MTAHSQEIAIEPRVVREVVRALDSDLVMRADRGGPRGARRFWDERFGAWSIAVLPGEIYVTDQDEHITTVLGSCVSTCVRHPDTRAGGLNHLVLPGGHAGEVLSCDGMRSLDTLVAGVLGYGGRAGELEVKIFGGGRVIAAGSDIGRSNVAAVRAYFAARGLAIAIADVGGGVARRLRYEPRTGRVLIRRMVMRDSGAPGVP
jgi:chemotaxis protein CheD